MTTDGGCFFLGGLFGYTNWLDPPAFSVKLKGGAYKLKGTVDEASTTVSCTGMEAKEPEMESGDGKAPGKIEAASLEFSGCSVETPSHCTVNSVGAAAGSIATNAVEAELVDNAAKTKVENLFKPKTGTTFAELEFKNKSGETCALAACGGRFTLSGNTLTEGGAEDELSKIKDVEAEEKLGTEELGEDVEKAKLVSEPSSKKYLNDETEAEAEAKLTLDGSAATLSGEATDEGKFAGAVFKSEETSEELTVKEASVDMGLEKE